jgi:hypothetical protein
MPRWWSRSRAARNWVFCSLRHPPVSLSVSSPDGRVDVSVADLAIAAIDNQDA